MQERAHCSGSGEPSQAFFVKFSKFFNNISANTFSRVTIGTSLTFGECVVHALPRFPFRLASGPAGPIARSVRRRADPEAPRSTKDRGATNRGSVACAVPLRRGEGSAPFSPGLVSIPCSRRAGRVTARRRGDRSDSGGSDDTDDAADEHETMMRPTFKEHLKERRPERAVTGGQTGCLFRARGALIDFW